jgi:3-mercaptopyruvate sulfurtransferase SseA
MSAEQAETMTTVGLKHAVLAMQVAVYMDANPDPIVVDVREPNEFCDSGGHIPGAVNYPWNSGARYDGSKTVDILVY